MKIPGRILLDSNFFIALRRKQPEALRVLQALKDQQLVTSALVKIEYAVGEFVVDPRQEKSIEALFERFEIVPFDEKAANKAAREAVKLGLPKTRNPHKKAFDLMIAACAWATNRVLVTENAQDFAHMPWVKTLAFDWNQTE
jgi:predicted nucleic acid-binding protein